MTIYQDHAYKHGVGWSTWHFQWVTKYRYKVFIEVKLQKLCEIFIYEAAKRHNFKIVDLEIDVDHVHVLVEIRPSVAPARVVNILKGYSARMLFMAAEKDLKKFYWRSKRVRSLWGKGKFIGSIGHITLEKAKIYLEAHHAKAFFTRNPHHLWLGRMSIYLL